MLERVNSEVSGSGPRPFDVGYTPRCELYLLEVNKPYENWVVLGRTGGSFEKIAFADLGLSKDREYTVFEFWSKKELGNFVKEFEPGPIDPRFNCQLFCIREKQSHPQLVATNRHISCGGLEVDDVKWDSNVLSGESRLVADDPYDLYISEPAGYDFEKISCEGADVVSSEKIGNLRVCRLHSAKGANVPWKIAFRHKEK